VTVRVKEDKRYNNLRTVWDTRWTPNNEEFRELLNAAINEAGNLRRLCLAIGIKQRHIRRIRSGHTKAVSFRVTDQILARTDVSYRILDLPWYTVNELMELGIWKPPFGSAL